MSEETALVAQDAPEEAVAERAMTNAELNEMSVLIPLAKNNPRDIHLAIEQTKQSITLSQTAAAECFYSLPRGGKQLKGASIGLAETLASNWGNLKIDISEAIVGEREVTVYGKILDSQSGLLVSMSERRNIWGKNGRYQDDMINITIKAAQSILYRNLIFRVVPRPVIAVLFESAMKVATGGEITFPERCKKVIDYWKSEHKVTQPKLLRHIGHTKASQISVEDIEYLLGLDQAIKSGDLTVAEAFKKPMNQTSETVVDAVAEELEATVMKNGIVDPETGELLPPEEQY